MIALYKEELFSYHTVHLLQVYNSMLFKGT